MISCTPLALYITVLSFRFDVMNQCWHPDPRGRPKFADLHKLFDYFLAQHTQNQCPYIDMDSSVPYVFDHLTSKTFSDYQSIQEEVINLDEEDGPGRLYATEGTCSSGYGSTKELSPDESCLLERIKNNDGPTRTTEHISPVKSDVDYDKLRTNTEHTHLTQVSSNNGTPLYHYDDLDIDNDNEDIQDYLLPPLHQYDFYNDIWMERLSTITEVSCEDCYDQMEGTVAMTTRIHKPDIAQTSF